MLNYIELLEELLDAETVDSDHRRILETEIQTYKQQNNQFIKGELKDGENHQ